jgi:hypothetical protein
MMGFRGSGVQGSEVDMFRVQRFKPQLKNEPQNIESRMPKYGFARAAQVLAPRVAQFF